MKTVIIRSFLFAFFAAIVMYISRILLRTDLYIADVSGLSAFATVFGTLYGIITAFIVFEVWGQFSQTQHLVEKEAMEIERLYRLTLYFKDKKFKLHMKKIIEDYTQLVIKDKFQYLGGGSRHEAEDKVFRKIAHLIRDISPDNDHDRTVFDHIVAHYGDLSDLRTDRIN
ncbi:MAG: DUF4239 domain-containing protein, partial [Candidatus Omnitrophica bacterium]|nr:DUF4239 domain-containing protein [Candidatus Omnitrophota bacterium]